MNSRTITYILGVLFLVVIRFADAKREPGKTSSSQPEVSQEFQPSIWRLLLASFLVLFAELAFIRWIAVEVRIFAYFKNLALAVL
jgi:hypothetical protein